MKKILLSITSILMSLSLFAIELPEGTNARVSGLKLSNGNITEVTLREDTEINTPLGVKVVTGKVTFYESGAVKSFTPVENGTVETEAGVLTYDGIKLITVEVPAEVTEEVVDDFSIWSEETVEIVEETPAETVEVTVIPAEITLYESGCVKEIVITEETKIKTKIGNLTVQPGLVEFYDNYVVKSYQLKNNCTLKLSVGSVKISKEGRLTFYDNGKIMELTVAEPCDLTTDIGTISTNENSILTFHSTGKLQSVETNDIYKLTYDNNDLYTAPDTMICFYKSGKLKQVTVLNNEIILGDFAVELAEEKSVINFYEDGSALIGDQETVIVKNYSVEPVDAYAVFYNPTQPDKLFVEAFDGDVLFGNFYNAEKSEGEETVYVCYPFSKDEISDTLANEYFLTAPVIFKNNKPWFKSTEKTNAYVEFEYFAGTEEAEDDVIIEE